LIITLRRGYALFDPEATGDAPRYLHRPEAEPPGNRFNDVKCDTGGRFWGCTMDFACEARTGALYCYAAGGSCVRHDMGYTVTNIPTWSRDGRTMYFNDTARGRVNACNFEPETGALSNPREWAALRPRHGLPDGMTTDAAGRLWIAHWGGACVSCHDPRRGAELGAHEPHPNPASTPLGYPRPPGRTGPEGGTLLGRHECRSSADRPSSATFRRSNISPKLTVLAKRDIDHPMPS